MPGDDKQICEIRGEDLANFNRICRIGDTPGVLLDPSRESVLECLVGPALLLGT